MLMPLGFTKTFEPALFVKKFSNKPASPFVVAHYATGSAA
jgi:hypothetical protein